MFAKSREFFGDPLALAFKQLGQTVGFQFAAASQTLLRLKGELDGALLKQRQQLADVAGGAFEQPAPGCLRRRGTLCGAQGGLQQLERASLCLAAVRASVGERRDGSTERAVRVTISSCRRSAPCP